MTTSTAVQCCSSRFLSKEDAAAAILSVHQRKINGYTARCSWSRRFVTSSDETSTSAGELQQPYQAPRTGQTALTLMPQHPLLPGDRTPAGAAAAGCVGDQAVLCSCQTTGAWPAYCNSSGNCAMARYPSLVVQSPGGPTMTSPPCYV